MKTNCPDDQQTEETAGTRALQWIKDALAVGKTVHICTATCTTVVSPKTGKRWTDRGLNLFKLKNGDLYIASGRSFLKLTAGDIALVAFKIAE